MTEDDYNQLFYFYKERGNILNWSDWDNRKEIIREKHPDLVAAVELSVEANKKIRQEMRDIAETKGWL